jgi:hypothetical protein
VLASVRRSNCTYGFPVCSFREDSVWPMTRNMALSFCAPSECESQQLDLVMIDRPVPGEESPNRLRDTHCWGAVFEEFAVTSASSARNRAAFCG